MFLMLAGVAVVLGVGGTLLAVRSTATSAPVRVSRLAYIGTDGNVHTVAADGGSDVSLTTDANPTERSRVRRIYLFPTWSPDSSKIAFVELSSEGVARVHSADPLTGNPAAIYSSGEQIPIYLSWAPDSRHLAFLTERDHDLALRYADGDGSGDELTTGAPLYFAWAPDSKSLVSHAGGNRRNSAEASVDVHVPGGERSRSLALEPGDFFAPAFSPDGREVLAGMMGQTEQQNTLVASMPSGGSPRKLATYSGSIGFAWSPDGKQVAYLVTPGAKLGTDTSLRTVNADGSGDRPLAEDSPLAFFWSPDGKRIAYLARVGGTEGALHQASPIVQQANLRLRWKVITLASQKTVTLATFTPTSPFSEMMPYFDQYAHSLRLWSPDSTSIVYSAQESEEKAGIYVTSADGGEPRRIASGITAAWSWR